MDELKKQFSELDQKLLIALLDSLIDEQQPIDPSSEESSKKVRR